MNDSLCLGIDIGTQGARVVVAEATGRTVAHAQQNYADAVIGSLPQHYHEQKPEAWWNATRICLRQVVAALREQNRTADEIVAGAVDATFGTIVLLDANDQPLRPALMFDDCRADAEAQRVNQALEGSPQQFSYRFDSSFALSKILWLANHEPAVWQKTRRVAHAADYIVGKLTGVYDVSDQSNVLKTGFDLMDSVWSPFIEKDLGIDTRRLPRVIRSGETVARVSRQCAEETGLSERTRIVAGMTNGTADQIASGARRVGDWNTVLGNTLAFRGLAKRPLIDPLGRVYCHLHPLGYWMPSSTSNAGARAVDARFPDADREVFNRAALNLSPTPLVVYPLTQQGERFPFNRADAQGFVEGQAQNEQELYAAYLEGIAFVERLAYGVLQSLGAEMRQRVYSTGDGFNSLELMQIRADVMGLEIARSTNANPPMGSAIVAASRTLFDNIADASAQMVRVDRVVSPRPEMAARYGEAFQRFLNACRQHGYVGALQQPSIGSP